MAKGVEVREEDERGVADEVPNCEFVAVVDGTVLDAVWELVGPVSCDSLGDGRSTDEDSDCDAVELDARFGDEKVPVMADA